MVCRVYDRCESVHLMRASIETSHQETHHLWKTSSSNHTHANPSSHYGVWLQASRHLILPPLEDLHIFTSPCRFTLKLTADNIDFFRSQIEWHQFEICTSSVEDTVFTHKFCLVMVLPSFWLKSPIVHWMRVLFFNGLHADDRMNVAPHQTTSVRSHSRVWVDNNL